MANQEHVTILEQGAAAWNEWRKGNPRIAPDLGWAELQERDLRNMDL